tara:strand:+ start:108 stop:617 length:510 start_codon:yes stop_codon:yes gene_type:complete
MIKLKELLKENKYWENREFGQPLPKLRLEQDVDDKPENEIPSHFGSGKEITVKGYKTKHFDICASAVSLFTKLDKVDNEEADKYIVEAAKGMDHIFEMEKAVVRKEALNHDPIKHGIELTNKVSYQLGYVAKIIGDDFMDETLFIPDHIMVMVKRIDSIKIDDTEKDDD